MSGTDASFVGSIPSLYDRHLGPLLFEPYAAEVGRRAAAFQPRQILETAAGTGIVTKALATSCPDAEIVATDLNQAMLDVAAGRLPSAIRFQPADAQQLPFGDAEFDLVVCQFGVMFFPDKLKANAEALRVLRENGRYLVVIWDRLEKNPASRLVHEAVMALFADDPPGFLARTPFGYADPAVICHDLLEAGFHDVEFETVALRSKPGTTTEDAAVGLVYGSPLRAEIEPRGADALERAADAARERLQQLQRPGGFDSPLSAHVVTATR